MFIPFKSSLFADTKHASIQTQKITILESNNFSCYGRVPVSWHNSDRNTLGTIKKLKGGNI